MTNKYAEGYLGRRYYGGCEYVDVAERLAIDRAKRLFSCAFANVQPHSGAQANRRHSSPVQPGDTILGMSLPPAPSDPRSGAQSVRQMVPRRPTASGDDGLLDYEELERLARGEAEADHCRRFRHPRCIDFPASGVADEVGAYFTVDMAHFAGLVAAGLFRIRAARACRHHDDPRTLAGRVAG
jgi:glycine hydroxymethyltransferase